MQRWKTSTILVAAAFGLSVVLLFAKAGMMRDRATAGRPVVTNHIYSPAAADPKLQDQRRAEQMTRRSNAAPAKAVIVREPGAGAGAKAKLASQTSTDQRPLHATPIDPTKPYYVVVGTFETRENAETELRRLQAKRVVQGFLGVFNDGKYTSVIARNFAREDQARLMLTELKEKHGVSGYIYHKTEE